MATADHPGAQEPTGTWEPGLTLLGLVGILDPPRTASEPTITACRNAGIVPVLITGDHPLTARAVATRLGITTGRDHEITTGQHIRKAPPTH